MFVRYMYSECLSINRYVVIYIIFVYIRYFKFGCNVKYKNGRKKEENRG